jgi:hypothetical protein
VFAVEAFEDQVPVRRRKSKPSRRAAASHQ